MTVQTAEIKLILGLQDFSNGTWTGVQIPYLAPVWPSVNRVEEEAMDYTGGWEAVSDVATLDSSADSGLSFDKVGLSDLELMARSVLGVPAVAGQKMTWTGADDTKLQPLAIQVGAESVTGNDPYIEETLNNIGSAFGLRIDSSQVFTRMTLDVKGNAPTNPAPTAFANATVDRDRGNGIKNRWWTLAIDDAVGDVGNTAITCNRILIEPSLDNNLDTQLSDCGPLQGRDKRAITINFTLFFDDKSAAEQAKFQGEAMRYIRLKAVDTADVNEWTQLDVAGKIRGFTHGTQGTYETVQFNIKSQVDGTWGYSWALDIHRAA